MESLEKYRSQEFDWALGINRVSLRLLGIWPADQDESSKSLLTVSRIPLMVLVIFGGLFLPQMWALALIIEQLPLAIDNLMTSCPAFTSCIKLFFIWRSKTILQPVIESVLQDYLRPKSEWEELTMRREASKGRLITIADYSLMTICCVGFIILPTLGFHVRIVNNVTDYASYGNRALLVQSYYPYDYYESPAFELTNLVQLTAAFFVGMTVAIPDDYFCALMFHVSGQFEILGLQIENLMGKDDAKEGVDWSLLGSFVERHVHLNRMVATLEKSFEFLIAAQILLVTVMVCCMGVQVLRTLNGAGEKPSPFQILTLSGTVFYLLLHTFVDCFVSESLTSRSSEIFFKIYSCRWCALPWNKVRCLLPMMLAAKTPRQIRAGRIMPLSLATYCSIVKSTTGYISMLVAVSGR
ncbi:odorant receptor 37 isoform X1 [Nasonia vitripennis]|uniref:Odorant receptor n=1 Tax=Nasonia vitripennis TaxID=7425 RepID=A0A7M6UDW6_NASVI|nr:odorant receptor 37 [Nasonia vitripennis]XP_031783065.1 odorant receptor 37 isoform X1 [Nasonia vitripennis]